MLDDTSVAVEKSVALQPVDCHVKLVGSCSGAMDVGTVSDDGSVTRARTDQRHSLCSDDVQSHLLG